MHAVLFLEHMNRILVHLESDKHASRVFQLLAHFGEADGGKLLRVADEDQSFAVEFQRDER